MSNGKLRKQFTNSEIQSAITEAGGSYTFAAKKLSELRGLTISRELVRYWARHLDTRRANGEPYAGTSVLDRQIREEMELRVPSPADDQKLYDTGPDNSRILNIPDQHAPYQHPDALWFLADVAAKLRPTRVINLGDECFPGDVEVMTSSGWMRFDKYSAMHDTGDAPQVMQVDGTRTATLVQPSRVVKKQATEGLLRFEHSTMVIKCTPRHNLVKEHPSTGALHRREAWDTAGTYSWAIPRTVQYNGGGVPYTNAQLQLICAFQADGTFTKGAVRFSFTKERKYLRLQGILNAIGIPYNEHSVERGDYQLYVEKDNVPEYLTKVFSDKLNVLNLSAEQIQVLVEEFRHWDAHSTHQGFRYVSCSEANVEFLHTLATLSGKSPRRIVKDRAAAEGRNDTYRLDVIDEPEKCSLKSATVEEVQYDGSVYCVTVPTGMILVRQEGWVSITGNCDGHALSFHDSDPNLDSAGVELEKAKEFIQALAKMFPVQDVCHSNHGSLVYRRALKHGIPTQYIKTYRDILFPDGGGEGWSWHERIPVILPNGDKLIYQHQSSGDILSNAAHERANIVQGHEHGDFYIRYRSSTSALYWAMVSGCLIDRKAYAFAYGRLFPRKPIIGCSAIIDSHPLLIPMPMDDHGRYTGKLNGALTL